MSDLFTAKTTGDVCSVCGVPEDDHLVRDWKQHKGAQFERREHHAFDEPKAVLVENQIQAKGVGVFSALMDRDGEMTPAIVFRFLIGDDDEDVLPDITYCTHPLELANLVMILREAVVNAANAAQEFANGRG